MKHKYDAVIVGSGAGGGMAAYVLTRRGLNVLLLEAGRHYEPLAETPMFQVEADAPLNGAGTPDKPLGYYDAGIFYGANIPGEPYTVAEGTSYRWDRVRMLGGRTNHWSRVCGRYGPYDFQTHSRYGLGVDWPITYEDVAPYYDKVERLIGVFGAAEGIENSPDSPDGVLLPPPAPRASELWIQMAVRKHMGIRMVPNHGAVLTRALNGRQACLYATPCERGCSIRANFQTTTVLLPPAVATGRLRMRCGAMAYNVALDKRGRASGVHYIDKDTGERGFAPARAVVLAASTGETARILLNSRSSVFPNGLANGSGQVGRNLTDAVTVKVSGELPILQGLRPQNDDGALVHHVMAPWQLHDAQRSGHIGFAMEYGIYPFAGRRMPRVEDFTSLPSADGRPLFGAELRRRVRQSYGSQVTLVSGGGMVPNANCRCDLDPNVKDKWGIPVLRFHWKWAPDDLAQAQHAAQTMREMMLAMGGNNPVTDTTRTLGGSMYNGHELGTARMGTTPSNSVLDAFSRAWDVRNLYITDGASFPGHPAKLPTETILALAWRASDHLVESFTRRDI